MLNKEEMKQSFCGWMPFLLPTSRNHSLDLIFSLTTKTPEQGRGATPFMPVLKPVRLHNITIKEHKKSKQYNTLNLQDMEFSYAAEQNYSLCRSHIQLHARILLK